MQTNKTTCHSLQPVHIPCNLWNTSNQKIAKYKGKQLSKTKVKVWLCQTIPHLGRRQNRGNCVCSGADATTGTKHGARTWGLLVCSSLQPAAGAAPGPKTQDPVTVGNKLSSSTIDTACNNPLKHIYTCSCGASGCMCITHKNLCALSEICISAAWGLNFPQLSATVNFMILTKGILPCHY